MGIVENMKDVVGLVQKADNIELYKQILELQSDIYDLLNENRELKSKIEDLSQKLTISEELTYKENAYWRNDDGPFCTSCWDTKKILVRVHSTNGADGTCPSCKTQIVFDCHKKSELTKKSLAGIAKLNSRPSHYNRSNF